VHYGSLRKGIKGLVVALSRTSSSALLFNVISLTLCLLYPTNAMPANRGSPTSPRPRGSIFLKPRRKVTPICELSERDLRELSVYNLGILASSVRNPSTPGWLEQKTEEQVKIMELLDALKTNRAVEELSNMVGETSISAFERMIVDSGATSAPLQISAKARALQKFELRVHRMCGRDKNGIEDNTTSRALMISPKEAEQIAKERLELDRQLQIKREESKKLSDAPNTCDMESDSEQDEDPANWFHDEEDDGIKGQQIVQPDQNDYSCVIRIDERNAYTGYNTFYEPK